MKSSDSERLDRREPVCTLVLRDGFGDLGESYLSAEINAQGALVVVAEERAPMCAAMNDELASQVWLNLASAWKDELLLRLLADRFASMAELTAYLDRHGIAFSAQAA